MITKQFYKENVEIYYFKDYTKITNSYLLTNDEIEDVAKEIEFSRHNKFDWKCTHNRRKASYIEEIKAHNRLYKIGLFRSHTVDTDLEEDLNNFEKITWFILGR